MRAHKTEAKIDESGNLIIEKAIPLPPGDVEIIILRVEASADSTETESTKKHEN